MIEPNRIYMGNYSHRVPLEGDIQKGDPYLVDMKLYTVGDEGPIRWDAELNSWVLTSLVAANILYNNPRTNTQQWIKVYYVPPQNHVSRD